MPDMKQARYFFEHQFLPKVFYENRQGVPVGIKKNPDVIHLNWENILKNYNLEDPFPQDAWKTQMFEIDPHLACIRLLCPEAVNETDCCWIFMLFRYDFTKMYYFTVEKGGFLGAGPYLCGWNPELKHILFGQCEPDREKALDRAIELFPTV